jgi:hypothetical protein
MLHAFKRWQSHTLRTLKRAPAPQQPGQLPRVLLVKLPNGGWGNRVPGLITGAKAGLLHMQRPQAALRLLITRGTVLPCSGNGQLARAS